MSAEPGGGITVSELALPENLTSTDAADFIAITGRVSFVPVADDAVWHGESASRRLS